MPYLLTFNCYGTHLRGDENGAVDRTRKTRGGQIQPALGLVKHGRSHANLPNAIRDFKAYASRALNQTTATRHWSRGWNTRYLSDRKAVEAATRYVADLQGSPMAIYLSPDL